MGVTGHCTRHYAHDGHPCHTMLPNPCSGMESHVRVPVASETTCKANCSLRASATRFRAPVASGLTPAEPPTTVQPLHRLGLGSPHCLHSGTGTSPAERAIPCVRLQELPRRAQGQAPVSSESAHPRHRINPASALRAGQTYSNQHASNRRRCACRHRSSHDAQDQAWPARRSSA